MKTIRCLAVSLSILLLASIALAQNPQSVWQQYATPEEAGWSSAQLAAAESLYLDLGAAAVLVVYDGKVLVSWGDPLRRFMCHSVRKSFLSALYGTHVDDGSIDLDKTLAELDIDDKSPLTGGEVQARIRDLLKARSGVYHPAAYETATMKKRRPERGSHAPGSFWYYNNWDFNTLGTILEQETGRDIFEDFRFRVADRLQMQDFRLIDGYHHYEPEHSLHPAYPFKMSARDMARFGLLFLRGGRWNGEQVISESWITESTAWYSDAGDGVGYGYMWWLRDMPEAGRSYYALGYGGHTIGILPDHNLVFVQRVDTYAGKSVPSSKTIELLRLILNARTGEPVREPELLTFDPPQRTYDSLRLEPSDLGRYLGQYPSAGGNLEIAPYEGGLLLKSPVFGSYRLLPLSPTEFFLEDMEQYAVVEVGGETPGRVTIHATRAVAELYDAMVSGGIESALAVYQELEDRDPGSHAFAEGELNRLGYELLRLGESAEAIEIFRLNVQAYPESFNVYDSLGEAYMTHGDYELAVKNYAKSLELNPQNANAKEKLEQLHQLIDKR